jgi:hypothetical protein
VKLVHPLLAGVARSKTLLERLPESAPMMKCRHPPPTRPLNHLLTAINVTQNQVQCHAWSPITARQAPVAVVIATTLSICSRSRIFVALSFIGVPLFFVGLHSSCTIDEVGANVSCRTLRVFGVIAGRLPGWRLAEFPARVTAQSPLAVASLS